MKTKEFTIIKSNSNHKIYIDSIGAVVDFFKKATKIKIWFDDEPEPSIDEFSNINIYNKNQPNNFTLEFPFNGNKAKILLETMEEYDMDAVRVSETILY